MPNIIGGIESDIVAYTAKAGGSIIFGWIGTDSAQGSYTYGRWAGWTFDASRSSSIYGSSETVTPESIATAFCIRY